MTLQLFLQPGWLALLLGWSFMVLAAAQLTIRLIMAFSVRLTLLGAVVLTVLALPIAVVYDLFTGPQASPALRLSLVLRRVTLDPADSPGARPVDRQRDGRPAGPTPVCPTLILSGACSRTHDKLRIVDSSRSG